MIARGILAGRSTELEQLARLLADAREGAGRIALLSGEPGIGKTRLAEELSRRAADAGFAVAWGRAWEGAGTPAYWPFTQLLRALADTFADAALASLLEPRDAPVALEPDE